MSANFSSNDACDFKDNLLILAQAACVCHACLRAQCVLACAMRSLAIVITIVQSFSPLFFFFSPSFVFDPQYFGITRRYILILNFFGPDGF